MKTVKQLLRQPLKTGIGIVFMTMAAAIVCLCVGQAVAAQATEKELNRRFSTVAIPMVQESLDGVVTRDSFLMDEEFLTWLDKMAAEHPDIVKQMAHHGILSAYIPELAPLNVTAEPYTTGSGAYYEVQPKPYAMPYNCAMLVITLDEVSQIEASQGTYPVENLTREDFDSDSDYIYWRYVDPNTEKVSVDSCYCMEITGTVTEVVSLADGYRNPVGRTARLSCIALTREELEAVELVPGEQYIVYGMDYVDEHWELISRKNANGRYNHLDLETYDPAKLRFLTEWEKLAYPEDVAVYDGIYLTELEYKELNAISMTLESPVSFVKYEEIRDEQTGKLLELVPQTDVSYTDENGETVSMRIDEYNRRYRIPTIAKLEGSVEDFLSADEGAQWQSALKIAGINNHAFTVIGVDRMDYLADFSLIKAFLTEGRDFTDEESESGARVCIIHETLAQANGIGVGDTITLNLYSTDYGLPYQTFRSDYRGILNPAASYYFSTTPIEETAEFTVVGVWRGILLWPDLRNVSVYSFSPNTVFVPCTSVQTEMETCNSVLFNTVVLENGQINAFHELVLASGYGGRLRYNDQDYESIAANFHNYETLGRQVLVIGAVLYTVLLALFLLLYPASQKKSVATMRSCGAGFARRFGHVLLSALGIAVPASVLGGWVGALLWDEMVAALQTSAESAVALQLEPDTLVILTAAQLLLATALSACTALFVAAPKRLSRRKTHRKSFY